MEIFAIHIYNSAETKGFSSAVSDQNTNIIMVLKRKIGQVDIDRSNNDWEDRRRRRKHQQVCQSVKTDREEIEMYFQATFTLSAFTETGQAELSIEVPYQRSYTGPRPAIPCSLADTPCATLGVREVVYKLNATLGTSRTSRKLRTILEDFIERNYDFGTAYALLRPVWDIENPSSIQDKLRRREGEDRSTDKKHWKETGLSTRV